MFMDTPKTSVPSLQRNYKINSHESSLLVEDIRGSRVGVFRGLIHLFLTVGRRVYVVTLRLCSLLHKVEGVVESAVSGGVLVVGRDVAAVSSFCGVKIKLSKIL